MTRLMVGAQPRCLCWSRFSDFEGPTVWPATESADAESAITVSDNTAVLALFSDLESLEAGFDGANAAIDALCTASGSHTQVATSTSLPPGAVTTFGQTLWSPSEAVISTARWRAAVCSRRNPPLTCST